MSDQHLTALAATGEAALAHVGVKGMKWGVRKGVSTFSNNFKSMTPADKGKLAARVILQTSGAVALTAVGASVATPALSTALSVAFKTESTGVQDTPFMSPEEAGIKIT